MITVIKDAHREDGLDRELLLEIADSNVAALEKLMMKYEERVFQFLLKLLNSRELAEEVAQDVFIKVWEKRETLRDIDSVAAWMYTVGRNQAFNVLKQIANRHVREESFSQESVMVVDGLEEIITKEYQDRMRELVDQLPPKRREIFRLKIDYGLSNEEIANKLEISTNTVKNQLSKAYLYLRRFISEHAFIWVLIYLSKP